MVFTERKKKLEGLTTFLVLSLVVSLTHKITVDICLGIKAVILLCLYMSGMMQNINKPKIKSIDLHHVNWMPT